MKKLIVVACLTLGAGILVACELAANGEQGIVATAVAQDAARGCSIIGTFATAPDTEFDESTETPPWITTATGLSAASGTIVTDVPHWPNLSFVNPATGEPMFPNAVRMTELKGVWERTGGNTIAFTQIGWAVDADGDAVYVVRNSGRTTLTDGCNTEIVESTMEWLMPGDEMAFFSAVIPDMVAHRITVRPPALPLD